MRSTTIAALAAILRGHLGLSAEAVTRVFPGYSPAELPSDLLRPAPAAG